MVAETEIKYYTLEEISQHDGVKDSRTWIILKDVVYDVTDYLDDHPGGGELITEWAGKDGTKEFDDFGHSSDAKKDLKKYKIGEVVEAERKKKTKENKQVEKKNKKNKAEQNGVESKQKDNKVVEGSELKYYTLEEISKHDGKQDPRTWIILKDVVYDVTDYLDDHPGGGELITEWAGKDGTKEFDDFGHSSDAKKDLKKYKIGEVVEAERKKKTKENKQVEKKNKKNKAEQNGVDSKDKKVVEGTELKYYTLEEISKHDGKQDPRTWIILKDVVYDVTDYLENHPGGSELITEWAGKDGTKEFDDFGHSSDAKKELKKYKIGEVVEAERKKKTKENKQVEKKTKKVEANNQIAKQKGPKIVESSDFGYRRSCISILTCGVLA